MRDPVTLGILAGGRGSRLGGVDKSTLRYAGATLLARTLAAFADADAGGGPVLVSHRDDAARLDSAVGAATGMLHLVHDLRPGQPGPLAGLEALLAATRTPWLLTAPVDLRDVPSGLGTRLRAALDADRRSARAFVEGVPHALLDLSPVRLGNLNTPEDFIP
jgi:molybdopterin-guanine dinucleotide biosynthesis protein A